MQEHELSTWLATVRAELRPQLLAAYGDGSPEQLAQLTLSVLVACEDRLKTTFTPPPQPCRRGCDACCRIHATATVPELLLLTLSLQESLSPQEQAALSVRIAERAEAIRGKPSARRMGERLPCGLLKDDGSCAAYDARPSACRGENSVGDPERCGPPARRPKARWGTQRLLFVTAEAALADLLTAKGLDPSEVEITLGLHILRHVPTALSRWLAGDREVFAPARVTGGPAVDRAGSRHLPLLPPEGRCR